MSTNGLSSTNDCFAQYYLRIVFALAAWMQTVMLSVCVVHDNVYAACATAVSIAGALNFFDAYRNDASASDDLGSCSMCGDVFPPRRPVMFVDGLMLRLVCLVPREEPDLLVQEPSRLPM